MKALTRLMTSPPFMGMLICLGILVLLAPGLVQATECYLPGEYPECSYAFCDPGNAAKCWVQCCDASGYMFLKPDEVKDLDPEIKKQLAVAAGNGDTNGNAKIMPIEGTRKSCAQYIGSYWTFKAKTYQICQIDPDIHIDGVDVELYSADTYEDIGCYSYADHYMKYQLDSVHCGWHSESTCEQRVTDRITQVWAPQGYYPTVPPGDDGDFCPTPRIVSAP